MSENTKTVSTRITGPFAKLLERYLEMDAHVTMGDFLRDAAREKIERDCPDLYKEMFIDKEESKEER